MTDAPWASTDARLADIERELLAREPIFHRTELGTTRADFEAQTVDDFWEVGASGRRYSREVVWQTLEPRYAAAADDPWEVTEPHCRDIGADTYLLTYTLRQDDRVTRRATVWQRGEGQWRIAYHQGTVVSD